MQDQVNYENSNFKQWRMKDNLFQWIFQAEWKCVAINDYGQSVTSCFTKLCVPKHFKAPRFLEELKASFTPEGTVNLECKVRMFYIKNVSS